MKDVKSSVHVLPYIEDMPSVLSSADLVVSRAGATTLAELTAIGAAAIIIPSPYVVMNHQEYNARELSDKQAAYLLLEKDLNKDSFINAVSELMNNPMKRDILKTNALSLGKPNACKDMYDLILELCERK
jgi:UDP-N-acetylglucosamine--N-acetylmuramyl-(pentapeptide) pyrophosphoryl-undecaprenol N-acetylglucosamine transferase